MTKLENEVHQAMAVMDTNSGKLLNYRQLMRHPKHKKDWEISPANEFGRLTNGVGGHIKGTNTIKSVYKCEVPSNRMKVVTCSQFVYSVHPKKCEKNQRRFVVGGDRINYPVEVTMPTAEMLVAKLLFNIVMSTKGARFMTIDISNFCFMIPLMRPKYIHIKLSDILNLINEEYNLMEKATKDGSIYIMAICGMYGLPHAGLLANKILKHQLNKYGY